MSCLQCVYVCVELVGEGIVEFVALLPESHLQSVVFMNIHQPCVNYYIFFQWID